MVRRTELSQGTWDIATFPFFGFKCRHTRKDDPWMDVLGSNTHVGVEFLRFSFLTP